MVRFCIIAQIISFLLINMCIHACQKTDDNMFMVLDLMNGGDLRYHLDRTGGFNESTVLVWAAELSCAINYLHANEVVHRDIKPDNVLLDGNGHVHLTDFNIAARTTGRDSFFSLTGTTAYMAPEVFKGSYFHMVDWWGLGILLYELIWGKVYFNDTFNKY
jgi:serine/threonine kinase 32